MTTNENITKELQTKHHYAMKHLYNALDNIEANGSNPDYWRGVVNGLEAAMDALGIEHEQFDPMH